MRKLIAFIGLILIFACCFAQESKVLKPMGSRAFKSYYKKIDKQADDSKKIKKGLRLVRYKNISSNQVYKTCLLFEADNNKLIYVREIYPKISDKSNALIICDAFKMPSHSEILWDFISKENLKYNLPKPSMQSYTDYLQLKDKNKDKQKDKGLESDKSNKKNKSAELIEKSETSIKNEEITDSKKQEVNTDKIKEKIEKELIKTDTITLITDSSKQVHFPDASKYLGRKTCESILNNKTFEAFYKSIERLDNAEEKTKTCIEYSYKYCFSTSQIMLLSNLIKNEKYKFILFKKSLENIYDLENFLSVNQLLDDKKLKREIEEVYTAFIQKKTVEDQLSDQSCKKKIIKLSDKELSSMKSNIRKEYSSSSKLQMAKLSLKQFDCADSKQITEIIRLFSSDIDKLDFAKYAYEYCCDKKEYISIQKLFISQQSKDELKEFIINF